MFAETLACEASDLFSAVTSVSGVVELEPGNDGGLAACTSDYSKFNRSVSVLLIHGDGDLVVPWTGDAILGFPPVPTDFSDWSERNLCVGDPVQTFSSPPISNQVYQNCSRSTQI